MNSDLRQSITNIQRRTFLGQACRGIGGLALTSLLAPAAASAADKWKGVITKPQVTPKAKRVIFLVMAGGPSHLELYDNKPTLAKLNGQPMPESVTKGQPIAQLQERSSPASARSGGSKSMARVGWK